MKSSFGRYLVGELAANAMLLALIVVSLPLWLPFWLYLVAKDWVAERRWYYELGLKYPEKDQQ